MLIRVTGDIIAMSPPFIVEKSHIDQAVSILARRSEIARLNQLNDAPAGPRRAGRCV